MKKISISVLVVSIFSFGAYAFQDNIYENADPLQVSESELPQANDSNKAPADEAQQIASDKGPLLSKVYENQESNTESNNVTIEQNAEGHGDAIQTQEVTPSQVESNDMPLPEAQYHNNDISTIENMSQEPETTQVPQEPETTQAPADDQPSGNMVRSDQRQELPQQEVRDNALNNQNPEPRRANPDQANDNQMSKSLNALSMGLKNMNKALDNGMAQLSKDFENQKRYIDKLLKEVTMLQDRVTSANKGLKNLLDLSKQLEKTKEQLESSRDSMNQIASSLNYNKGNSSSKQASSN